MSHFEATKQRVIPIKAARPAQGTERLAQTMGASEMGSGWSSGWKTVSMEALARLELEELAGKAAKKKQP